MAASKVPEGCPLSARQFHVLQLLCDGLTYGQIALELQVAVSTVRSHAEACYKALGVDNVKQAMSHAGKHGWLGWEPADDPTPLAVKHPFLAAYLQEFERSRWPHEPDPRSVLGMRLALAGHRNATEAGHRCR